MKLTTEQMIKIAAELKKKYPLLVELRDRLDLKLIDVTKTDFSHAKSKTNTQAHEERCEE